MGKIFGFHLGFDRKSNANKKGLKMELIGLDFFGLYRVHPDRSSTVRGRKGDTKFKVSFAGYSRF